VTQSSLFGSWIIRSCPVPSTVGGTNVNRFDLVFSGQWGCGMVQLLHLFQIQIFLAQGLVALADALQHQFLPIRSEHPLSVVVLLFFLFFVTFLGIVSNKIWQDVSGNKIGIIDKVVMWQQRDKR
jgi:hypothetical protein